MLKHEHAIKEYRWSSSESRSDALIAWSGWESRVATKVYGNLSEKKSVPYPVMYMVMSMPEHEMFFCPGVDETKSC
jgi:hypothetical protein